MSEVTPASEFVVEPVSIEELKARYPERAGADQMIPNSLRIMARDPELAAAMGKLAYTVAFRPGKVDRGLKWLVGHMASIICLYGWFNRWNDMFHTPLEDEPLAYAHAHLAPTG